MFVNRSFPVLFVLTATTGLITGCTQAVPDDAEQPQEPELVAVRVVTVAEEEIRQSSVQPATVEAFYVASIRPKVDGYLSEVKADIGDRVAAGQMLAVIDVPEMNKERLVIEARQTRAEAERDRASAGVDLAKSSVVAAEALAAEARSQLQQVEASLTAAEAEFTRTEDLVQRGSVQPRLLDEVRKRRDSETARRASVTSAIASADARVKVAGSQAAAAEADLRIADAEIAILDAELNRLDELIGFATLKAPFAGVITKRHVAPGDLVRATSSDDLFVIAQTDKVRVRIPLPEQEATLVNPGDEVNLTFPSLPDRKPITASVTRMTGDIDPNTRTMAVEVELENADNRLVPGMFGRAQITLQVRKNAAMLPARAVRFSESGEASVYVVDNETVSVVPVTTGFDDGTTIEITSGVQPGQTVIGAHLQRFADQQRVRILK